MMASSSTSRGRSLTPPSLKQNSRVSSMNHVRTQDFYPPFYPPHPAMYTDPAFYRAYGDPYLMQRLPPGAFLPPRSSPPPSSASRSYRNMYSSSNSDHYPPVASRKRSRRSRSPNRRRYAMQLLLSLFFYTHTHVLSSIESSNSFDPSYC